jgi:hypothetical protein
MVRRLVWVGLVVCAGWIAVPLVGPAAIGLVSQRLGYSIEVESLSWTQGGLCAAALVTPYGRADKVECILGWERGPALQIRIEGARLHAGEAHHQKTLPSLPAWFAVEVSVSRSQLSLEGSDLRWNCEGSLRHEAGRDRLWLAFLAGTSHIHVDLGRQGQSGWSGQIDAEKVPLTLLTSVSHRLRHEMLGELEISRGTASGHLEVDEGLSHGDILLENLAAEEKVLGLEVGIREGLLSLSGEEGIHLNVSEHGWISWGNTGLEGLVGSILWKDRLELDLSGAVKGIDQKHVRVSTSQRPEGLVTRLELLRIPVRPAVAEITFLGPHHSQSRIQLRHFGPEENGWLGHLLEPLLPLPAGTAWTANNLDATALIEWAEGRPRRVDLEDCRLADFTCQHPLLGEATLELVKGSLCIEPDKHHCIGQLRAEGCRLDKDQRRLFEQGSLTAQLDSTQGLSFDLAASVAGEPWALSLKQGSMLKLSSKGSATRFKQCFAPEEWLRELLPEAWKGEMAWDAQGLRLQGELQVNGRTAQLDVVAEHPLPDWKSIWEPSFWLQSPWKASLKNFSASWQAGELGADLSFESHLSWREGQLDVQVWPQQGLVHLGPLHKKIARTEQPLLAFSGRPSGLDGTLKSMETLLLPSQWEATTQWQLQFSDLSDRLEGKICWSHGKGRLHVNQTAFPLTHVEASWDQAEQWANAQFSFAHGDPLEFRCGLVCTGPGTFSLQTLNGEDGRTRDASLALEVDGWRPTRWSTRGFTNPHAWIAWWENSGSQQSTAVPAGLPFVQLAGWKDALPRQVCFDFEGGRDRDTHLKVCADTTPSPAWTFGLKGGEGQWEIEETRVGPLQVAGRMLASAKGVAIEQGRVAASSGEQVVAVSLASWSDADHGSTSPQVEVQLSKTGLAALLDDLALWLGSREKWARWIRLNSDLQATITEDPQRGWVLRIPSLEGKLRAVPLSCKDIEVWMEGHRMRATGTFCNRGRRDPFSVELTQSHEGSGELLLEVAGERCRCGWLLDAERGFCPLMVDGGIFGQVGRLSYAPGDRLSLVGSLSLDLRSLIPLVPDDVADAIEKLSLGKGVIFQGRVDLSDDISMEGKLVGNDVEAFGAVWDKLSADFYCSPQVLCLSELHMDDPAGEIRAPRIELRELAPKTWQIDVPIAGARHLVMSRLRWPGSHKRAVKNLVIEEILLQNILGPAERPQEWSGNGLFSFENEAPRPALLFLPAELLGNLGLDLALLEPVRGRIHFAFEDGVIRLKELEDVVSIKNRSRFFLHPDPGFAVIGFDGSVNIRIWMKQFVVLKITQPLNLYITGNLKDPEISFQHSDKRCALSTCSETASTCSSPQAAGSAENR